MQTKKEPKSWVRTLGSLSWSHAFWATLIYEQLKAVFTDSVPTLGVGGGKLYVNTEYFEDPKFNDNNRIFMVAHEVSHEMYFHPHMLQQYQQAGTLDGEPFDPKRFNMAGDYIINDMLRKFRIGEYHKDWLWCQHFSWEDGILDVYKRLKPKNPPPSAGGGGGQGDQDGESQSGVLPDQKDSCAGDSSPAPQQYDILDKDGNIVGETPEGVGTQDSHLFDEPSPYSEQDWKQAVAGAYQQAKSMGQGSVEMERWMEDYLESKRDWREELRDYVVVSRGRETFNWQRPHKRKMRERGIPVPTRLSFAMGDIAYIHDVSGSVSYREHMACMGAGVAIATDCKPKSIRVLCCAGRVTDDQHYDSPEQYLDWKPKGTGGTDMEEAFRYLVEDGFIPEVCIVLTDGYTPFTEPPPFPVVWLTTGKAASEFPYGHAIELELE